MSETKPFLFKFAGTNMLVYDILYNDPVSKKQELFSSASSRQKTEKITAFLNENMPEKIKYSAYTLPVERITIHDIYEYFHCMTDSENVLFEKLRNLYN